MKKTFLMLAALVCLSTAAQAQITTTINFDTDSNWTGSGSLSSYNSGHVYSESNWTFTGGPALRQTTATQDGVAGALGTYAWRLNQNTSVSWTATYTSALDDLSFFTNFNFDVRRWDGSPSPAVTVSFSLNGGSTFTSVGTIDNTFLGNSSAWSNFSYDFASDTGLAAGQFIVRLTATTGERIMVDNFSATVEVTAVPEPHEYAIAVVALLGVMVIMRSKRRRA